MMRLMLLPLLVVMVPAAARPIPLTPEATFDLYMRTAIEDDPQARREFETNLGSALHLFPDMKTEASSLAEALPSGALEWLVNDAGVDDAARAQQAWTTAVLRNTRCRALSSDIWHRLSDGYRVATIRFSCQVGDTERLRTLSDASMFDPQEEEDDRFWSAYVALLRDGPFKTIYGTSALVMAPDSEIWHSEAFDPRALGSEVDNDVGSALAGEWQAMHSWWLQTMRMTERRMTLVAECDELVQQYRRCAARFAPQELLGAYALAKQVSDQHGTIADSELAQQCVALRPNMEALWPEPCE